MQKILFPMQYMNITQGVNEGTHVNSGAIDCAGKDKGIDNIFAPFDGVVKNIWKNGATVWLESINPVEFADGSIDYATIAVTHDNDINDLRVGQIISQGTPFYQEGTAGNATGNHVHLEIARGKFTGTGWTQNAQGYWVLNNYVYPWLAFWLSDTIVINGYGYNWRTNNVKPTIETLRIAQSEIGGTDRNYAHSGDFDKQMMEAHGYKDVNDYIYEMWLGGSAYREQKDLWQAFYNRYSSVIDELLARPVTVVKEVRVEIPIEKIIIKEVNITDKDRTFWDLIKAAFNKLGEK